MAKAKGIPTIVGIKDITTMLDEKALVIMDSIENKIVVNPTKEVKELYNKKIIELKEKNKKYAKLKNEEAVTLDGKKIKLYGNIGNSKESAYVSEFGGSGVGLFRTEFFIYGLKTIPFRR